MAKTSKKTSFILITLILITFLAAILRLYQLSQNPPSLYSDEADIAFQASFFNQCRTDYFGNKFPIHFHSFADYQPSFYIYLVSLSQTIFGVNEFSTRFPAAIFGIFTIPLIYFLSQKLFKSTHLSLITAFILAINPWHIHYSRAAFAVTLMLFFLLLSLFFFYKYLESKNFRHLLLFALSSVLTLYTYSTSKLYLIFFLLTLGIIYFKEILQLGFKKLFLIFLISLLLCLPLILDTINGHSGYRFSYINIFSDPTIPTQVDFHRFTDAIVAHGQQIGLQTSFLSKLAHNKLNSVLSSFSHNYLQAFSTDFLFLKSDLNLRHGFSTFGYFYPIELLFSIIGLIYFFIKVSDKKLKVLLSVLFLFSPVPSALTNDSATPHGTRLILMLPFFAFLISFGIYYAFHNLNHFLQLLFKFFLPLIYLVSIFSFVHHYFVHYPQISASQWHLGLKESIQASQTLESKFSSIYFSNSYEPFTPFFLLYHRDIFTSCTPPTQLQVSQNSAFFSGYSLNSKYYIGHLEWPNIDNSLLFNSLFVLPTSEFDTAQREIKDKLSKSNPKINILKTIKPNYETAIPFTLFSIEQNED